MGFSDYQNEDAIDLLADLLEPASVIFSDKDLQFMAKQGNTFKIARLAMKKHKKELLEILARIDGVPVDEYKVTAPALIMKLITLMNDKDMMRFFGLAATSGSGASSTSVTETTVESEK